MRGAWVIAKRELLAYFHSPVAYVAISGYLFLRGMLFIFQLISLEVSQITGRGQTPEMEQVIQAIFGQDLVWSFLLIVPLLTMRLLSEERSQQTAPLLLTAPVGTGQVVLGKFLAAQAVVAIMTLLSLTLPGIVVAYSGASLVPVVGGVISSLLFGALLVSVGILASSLSESQFVSALLAVTFNLILYLFGTGITGIPFIGESLDQFSIISNMEQLSRGVVDTAALVFFLTGTGFFLFLTARLVDSQRWR